jgi:hypothetical protein
MDHELVILPMRYHMERHTAIDTTSQPTKTTENVVANERILVATEILGPSAIYVCYERLR